MTKFLMKTWERLAQTLDRLQTPWEESWETPGVGSEARQPCDGAKRPREADVGGRPQPLEVWGSLWDGRKEGKGLHGVTVRLLGGEKLQGFRGSGSGGERKRGDGFIFTRLHLLANEQTHHKNQRKVK